MSMPSPPPREPAQNAPAHAEQVPQPASGPAQPQGHYAHPHAPHPQNPYQQAHPYAPYPQARIQYPQYPPVPVPVPVIDAGELRPRARWYWIGGLTIPIGGLTALLVFLSLLLSATEEPEFIAEFRGGDSATFQVEEGQEGYWGLYVEGDANRFACELDTPSGPGYGNDNLDTAPHSYSGTGYDSWRLTAELSTPEPGEYELRCDDVHTGTYGIAALEQTASAEAKLITGVLVLVVLGLASFVFGVVVLVVTLLRRSSHRARLVRERMGQAAGAPQPAPGPQQGPGPRPGAEPAPGAPEAGPVPAAEPQAQDPQAEPAPDGGAPDGTQH
ncbi:hypothetical protein [Nocardiopsis sp. Huas11]|uniref:hypothetical protein n=1 Tax=Nocardiopsis sp. Huas11 TaxID=2183912 RepID=UPI001F2C494B|nr:hypothetical protein [Nocardiopsis sp. Huas11]